MEDNRTRILNRIEPYIKIKHAEVKEIENNIALHLKQKHLYKYGPSPAEKKLYLSAPYCEHIARRDVSFFGVEFTGDKKYENKAEYFENLAYFFFLYTKLEQDANLNVTEREYINTEIEDMIKKIDPIGKYNQRLDEAKLSSPSDKTMVLRQAGEEKSKAIDSVIKFINKNIKSWQTRGDSKTVCNFNTWGKLLYRIKIPWGWHSPEQKAKREKSNGEAVKLLDFMEVVVSTDADVMNKLYEQLTDQREKFTIFSGELNIEISSLNDIINKYNPTDDNTVVSDIIKELSEKVNNVLTLFTKLKGFISSYLDKIPELDTGQELQANNFIETVIFGSKTDIIEIMTKIESDIKQKVSIKKELSLDEDIIRLEQYQSGNFDPFDLYLKFNPNFHDNSDGTINTYNMIDYKKSMDKIISDKENKWIILKDIVDQIETFFNNGEYITDIIGCHPENINIEIKQRQYPDTPNLFEMLVRIKRGFIQFCNLKRGAEELDVNPGDYSEFTDNPVQYVQKYATELMNAILTQSNTDVVERKLDVFVHPESGKLRSTISGDYSHELGFAFLKGIRSTIKKHTQLSDCTGGDNEYKNHIEFYYLKEYPTKIGIKLTKQNDETLTQVDNFDTNDIYTLFKMKDVVICKDPGQGKLKLKFYTNDDADEPGGEALRTHIINGGGDAAGGRRRRRRTKNKRITKNKRTKNKRTKNKRRTKKRKKSKRRKRRN